MLCRAAASLCPVVLQHHGELPWSGPRGALQRFGLCRADGFLFTADSLAEPWRRSGGVRRGQPVFEVMEASSPFRSEARDEVRSRTGLTGSPVVLWAGNLDSNKDPLTVLRGFEKVLSEKPEARLYMAFRGDALLAEVKARIDTRSALRGAVTLLGTLPYGEMEACFNSADIFVQGSRKEGSGIAVLDALACGVVPVVTDIAAFRAITREGSVGALWPVGDADAFAAALRRVIGEPIQAGSEAAILLHREYWTEERIGRAAVEAYSETLDAWHSAENDRDD